MRFKKIISIASAAIVCLSLTACGTSGAETFSFQDSAGAAEAATASVTLTESWEFTTGFYPVITAANSNNYGSTYWNRNFYNTLVCYDESGKIQGELAEDWEISKDGLTYTFTLRDDVKFSDGTPLTAGAVKTSMEEAIKNLDIYIGSYGKLASIIVSMEAPDDKTFVMTLTQPYYGALNDLTMCNPLGIVNPSAFGGDPYTSCAKQTMGTGPYLYAGDFDGTTYTFVRNPYYWGNAPALDGFKVKVIEDNDAKVLALRSGEIDTIIGSSRMSYDAYGELSSDSAYGTAVNATGSSTRYLGLNLSKAPFDNLNVRQAVAYALDQNSICSTVFQGVELPAETLFDKTKPYCDVTQMTYEFNLDKANALMDEAGWVDTDSDGIREKAGKKLEFTLSYTKSIGSLDDAALAIASQLTKIGFKITPSGTDMMTWFGAIQASAYEITIYLTYGGAYDPTTVVTNMNPDTSTDPIAVQVSSALDGGSAIITELNSTSDMERAQEIYTQLLGAIAEQSLMVPVSYPREFAAWKSKKISGYDFYSDSMYVLVANIQVK